MNLKNFFLSLIVLFFIQSTALAQQSFVFKGNKRISNDTIRSIIGTPKSDQLSVEDINAYQKKLFDSGFFEKVDSEIIGNKIIFSFKENPLIEFYYLDGVVKETRQEFFEKNLNLNSNKIFSENLLKTDIEKIKSLYKQSGYIDVKVNPIISVLDNNNINLIIKIDKGKQYKINRIFFIGDKKYKNSTLIDQVSSSETGWWKIMSSSILFSEERLEYDKFLIKKFYQDEGFYDMQIISSSIDILENNLVNLTFSINSGEVFKFGQISIKDNLKILNPNDLTFIEKLFKKRITGTYSKKKIISFRDSIYDFLNKNKYEFVDFKFNEINKGNIIDIELNFFNEKRKFVKNIKITGNQITEEKVIRDNLLVAEGDAYLNYKSEKSIKQIKDTGIFKTVKKTVSNSGNELIDLLIEVEEQPTGSIGAGVGVGSEQSFVSTQLSEKNLFGKGIKAESVLSVGTQKISGNIDFTIPDFLNSGSSFTNSFFVLSTNFENAGYESKKIGNNTSYAYSIFEDTTLSTGFGIDQDDIKTNSNASPLLASRKGTYNTISGFYDFKYDVRDSSLNSKKGYMMGFNQNLALPGSDVEYLKNRIYGTYYYPLNDDFILNFKSGASSINSLNSKDIKLSDRLFLNGSQLRGFQSMGTGPVQNTDHIGGNYSAYASISSTFPNPLPDKWNAKTLAFIDAGDVWGVDYDSSNTDEKIRSSYGVSLDWRSPLGPLNFTLANTISKSNTDKEESFSFRIGSIF